MATVIKAPTPPSPPEYTFTVKQYHQMIDAGIITEEDRVELIEGVLVPKMTRKPPHCSTADRLVDALRELLPKRWRVRDQKAIALSDGEPEPDAAVVLGPVGRYDDHHPTPEEIALIGEVAVSSVSIDRGRKRRTYARAGIPVYWIVNLVDRQIEVYTEPQKPRRGTPAYAAHVDYRPGQEVPVVIAGTTIGKIAVDAILPPG